MTLHPLTSKGGAFVLKLGLVFKQKNHPLDGFFVCIYGAPENEGRIFGVFIRDSKGEAKRVGDTF